MKFKNQKSKIKIVDEELITLINKKSLILDFTF